MVDKIIEVKNIKKTFQSYERGQGFFEAVKALVKRKKKIKNAVRGVNLEIKESEVVGFLGPNGAGKSTTIKIMSGVMHPDSGMVKILGYIPWKQRKEYVRNIGVVFGQKSQLFWDLPPIDSFYLHKSIYSIKAERFEKQLKKLVKMLGIEDIMKKPTRQLSLGERMRCEFVMAMLHEPKVVFLDEPTIGLDVFAKETIRSFIKRMNKEEGTTFIVTSHDLEDIENLCDRVIIINEGVIVFDNVVEELKTGKKKYITIKFYDKIDFDKFLKIRGIKIMKVISEYSVQLEVDTSKTSLDEIIKRLRMGKKVEDLDVENPPITELIKKLYKSKKRAK
ncbi:ATP-binding cassette domain-containing protein [Candidatus Woesearchaeota archaeon]|nr:ATP-binding cassette domain-containing protein [Candidatus Woesearchaeota archaeon]